MIPTRHIARINDLWTEIGRLETAVVVAERAAADMSGTELECQQALERAANAKAALMRALREHSILTHFVLTTNHGARAA